MDLLGNMIKGFTGDEDELAIIRLINCLSSDKVRVLVSRPGFNVNDFDAAVHGRE